MLLLTLPSSRMLKVSSSPGEPRSPQSKSLSLRRRAAALSETCQAPRDNGLRRSNHPLQPSGCRMRFAAKEHPEPSEQDSRGFRGGQLGSAAGLCSKAIMQTPVVEAVVPWLSRSRLCDFGLARKILCEANSRCHPKPRLLRKNRVGQIFFGMCGSGIVKGTASPGAFGLFAGGSGFFGRAVKRV